MSWQAQTAVTRHSQQTKLKPFKLLHLLAERADKEGVIDPAPSQPTLAAELDCSDRMIRNHLDTLIESGELQQTRVGSGPGRPSAYQIMLPMPTGKQETAGEKVEKTPDNLSTKVNNLEAKVEIIMRNLSTIMQKVETMVEKVEGKGGNDLDELAAHEPILEPEEENKTPPNPPGGKPRATKPKTVAYEIPVALDTPEFRASWAEYECHRNELHKKLTPTAAKRQLKSLEVMGLQRALVAIPYSIGQGWSGIYEPKPAANGNGHRPPQAVGLPEIVTTEKGW